MNTCQRMQTLEHAAAQFWATSRSLLHIWHTAAIMDMDLLPKLWLYERCGVRSLERAAGGTLDVFRGGRSEVGGWIERLPSDVGTEA